MFRVKTSICAAALAAVSFGAQAAAPGSIELPGDRAFPESITASRDGTLYVSNLEGGGILRIRPQGKPEAWLAPGAAGTRSTLGVLVDESRQLLWVCSNDMTIIGIASPGTQKGSFLKGFDLASGKEKVSAAFPAPTPPAGGSICNDIAIDGSGAVYVTDTLAPQILKLSADQKTLGVWKTDPLFAPKNGGGLDGLVFDASGNLIVNKIGSGELLRVDVKNGAPGTVTELKTSRPLDQPDALRLGTDGSLLLVEGGGSLDKLVISGDTAKVETIEDGFTVPTGVVQVGKGYWISEGQNGYLLDPALKDQAPKLPFRLHYVPAAK
ncbi:hypothetical protein [Hydrocarboniphaga effusa]|uniref:Vgb family protein n=1 Tax=Hydrocarboniphaga effusa TaxID=243629 RepID=UPI00398C138C